MNRVTKHVLGWTIGVVVVVGAAFGIAKLASETPPPVADYPVDKVGASDWVLGNKDAKVVLIEYSDLQCPACLAYYPVVKQLHESYPDELAVVYREFPLRTTHKNANSAAQAAEAAGIQGKFWEMHDTLFEKQSEWANLGSPFDTFVQYAQVIGIDADKFRTDYASSTVRDSIDRQLQSGEAAKVNATPTFFLQGEKIQPPASLDAFKQLIDEAVKNAPLTQDTSTPVHIHANLRVAVDGTPIDFSQDKYQKNADGKELSEDVHFHDGNGDVLHVHKGGVTLGDFLKSVGMGLSQDCVTLDASTTKCATGADKVKFLVNGQENTDYGSYVLKDLDRMLIYAGPGDEPSVQKQVKAVADTACIYSETCPERGKPPKEDCVGGLGTDCT